ncbi:MAG: hypothetical protein ABJL67_11565 [Sulfitobacter sp.]
MKETDLACPFCGCPSPGSRLATVHPNNPDDMVVVRSAYLAALWSQITNLHRELAEMRFNTIDHDDSDHTGVDN